jgi:hypothetical protein
MRNRFLTAVMLSGVASAISGGGKSMVWGDMLCDSIHKGERKLTPQDLERIAKAEAKRKRKREARTSK